MMYNFSTKNNDLISFFIDLFVNEFHLVSTTFNKQIYINKIKK